MSEPIPNVPVPVAEYRDSVLACYLAAKLLAQHDLPKVIAAIEQANAVGPIVDPTAYREKAQAMNEDLSVVRAALPIFEKGREIIEKIRAGQVGRVAQKGRPA